MAARPNPALPHGTSDHAAPIETDRKKPSNRRSKNPTTPTRTQRPKKWRISHIGHSHGSTRIPSEMAVPRSQKANASSVGAMSLSFALDVRHIAPGDDRREPQRQRCDRKSARRWRHHVRRAGSVHAPFDVEEHDHCDDDDPELGHEDSCRALGRRIGDEERDTSDGVQPEAGPHDRKELAERGERDLRREPNQPKIEDGARPDQHPHAHRVKCEHSWIRPDGPRLAKPRPETAAFEQREEVHHVESLCKAVATSAKPGIRGYVARFA